MRGTRESRHCLITPDPIIGGDYQAGRLCCIAILLT